MSTSCNVSGSGAKNINNGVYICVCDGRDDIECVQNHRSRVNDTVVDHLSFSLRKRYGINNSNFINEVLLCQAEREVSKMIITRKKL